MAIDISKCRGEKVGTRLVSHGQEGMNARHATAHPIRYLVSYLYSNITKRPQKILILKTPTSLERLDDDPSSSQNTKKLLILFAFDFTFHRVSLSPISTYDQLPSTTHTLSEPAVPVRNTKSSREQIIDCGGLI